MERLRERAISPSLSVPLYRHSFQILMFSESSVVGGDYLSVSDQRERRQRVPGYPVSRRESDNNVTCHELKKLCH